MEHAPTDHRRPALAPLIAALMLLVVALPAAAGAQERPDDAMRSYLKTVVTDAEAFDDRFQGEVWLTDMANRLKSRVADPLTRIELLKLVHIEAARAELPPELVLAVIDVESNFDRFAISYAGARGLMQVMPFWLDEIGRPGDNLFHMQTNLRFGCSILKIYLEREKGNLHRALARYNGSVGKNWYPDRVFKALSNRWYRQ